MTQVLFVLQNSWRRGAKEREQEIGREEVWQRLLWRSMTGKRLREMIPDNIEYEVVNASPFVGSTASSSFPADCLLMHSRMRERQPAVVVLLGKVAQALVPVVERYDCTFIVGPHPAWRLLSKEHTAKLKKEIADAASSPN